MNKKKSLFPHSAENTLRRVFNLNSKIILKSKINIVTKRLSEKEIYVWNSRLCRT